MNSNLTKERSDITILRSVYNQFKKQVLSFRIIEAERNLKKGKVEEMNSDAFIKSI